MQRTLWIRWTLSYLFITALAGAVMRIMAFTDLGGVRYEDLLHAHSHLAILGWVYAAMFLLILASFSLEWRRYRRLFAASQVVSALMFIAFVLQGYALFSIAFSTLHIFLSYAFAYRVWMEAGNGRMELSVRMLRGSLLCLVLSSVGPWTLAVTSATGMKGSAIYDMAVYFYLHFQYNGWMTLGLGAIFLQFMKSRGFILDPRLGGYAYRAYFLALFPGYILSILWVEPGAFVWGVAALSGFVQWGAVLLFLGAIRQESDKLGFDRRSWIYRWMGLAGLALFTKVTLELGLAIPSLSTLVYDTRSIVIGYLHLALVGFVTFLILGLWIAYGFTKGGTGASSWGEWLFIAGFVLNEGGLFGAGLLNWLGAKGVGTIESVVLLAAAILMMLGCLWLLIKSNDRPAQAVTQG